MTVRRPRHLNRIGVGAAPHPQTGRLCQLSLSLKHWQIRLGSVIANAAQGDRPVDGASEILVRFLNQSANVLVVVIPGNFQMHGVVLAVKPQYRTQTKPRMIVAQGVDEVAVRLAVGPIFAHINIPRALPIGRFAPVDRVGRRPARVREKHRNAQPRH